jgi:hypothetical protein
MSEIRATAIHESAHATASYFEQHERLGTDIIAFGRIWISEYSPGRYEGALDDRILYTNRVAAGWSFRRGGTPIEFRDVLAADAIISLAVPLAEARYSRKEARSVLSDGGRTDCAQVRTLIELAETDQDRQIALWVDLITATNRLLRRPEVWRAVNAVADRLIIDKIVWSGDALELIRAAIVSK